MTDNYTDIDKFIVLNAYKTTCDWHLNRLFQSFCFRHKQADISFKSFSFIQTFFQMYLNCEDFYYNVSTSRNKIIIMIIVIVVIIIFYFQSSYFFSVIDRYRKGSLCIQWVFLCKIWRKMFRIFTIIIFYIRLDWAK